MKQFNEARSMEALYVIASMTEDTKWYFEIDYLYEIIKDPKLKNSILLASTNYDDYEVVEKYKDNIYKHITQQMSKTLLDGLKDCPIDVSEYIDFLAHNRSLSPIKLSENDIVDLMMKSSSKVFLEAWSMDEDLNLSEDSKARIKERIESLEEKSEERDDEEDYDFGYGFISDEDDVEFIANQYFDNLNTIIAGYVSMGLDQDDQDLPDFLQYTQDEMDAINTYGGNPPGGSALASFQDSYHIINALMYPGIHGEVEKFYNEDKDPRSSILENPEALVSCYKSIISSMVKYSLQMEDTVRCRRVDRNLGVELMKEVGSRTASFFSTTLMDYDEAFASSKIGVALEEVEIEPGVLCIDFKDILKDKYTYAYEAEVLVGPYVRGDIEEIPLDTYDFSIKDKNGEPPQRKVMITFSKEEQKPLSDEEKQDVEDAYKVLHDPDMIKNARAFLDMLKTRNGEKKRPFELFKETLDPEVVDNYLEYKGALQLIIKSLIREETVRLTELLEEYERENGPLNMYRASTVYGEGTPVITGDDLRELAEAQTPDQIFSAVDNSTRVLGEENQTKEDERGDHDEN